MFMRIVQQVNGTIQGLYTQAYTLVVGRLLPSVKQLLVNTIQALQDAVNQVAKTIRNIKALVVSQTTAAPSTNPEPINVQAETTLLGLQPQAIVPPTLQPVVLAQSRKRGKPVGSTKSDKSSSKRTTPAQTRTGRQSMADGEKSAAVASQLRQHATQAPKKGK